MAGRHFLQIPGPSNTPDRILRAMDQAVPDHRGPKFGDVGMKAIEGMKKVFKTEQEVFIYPASGTGAWEAALSNTMSPGWAERPCRSARSCPRRSASPCRSGAAR